MLETDAGKCSCPKTNCVRHGKCSECIKYHEGLKKYVPSCKRQKKRTSKAIRTK